MGFDDSKGSKGSDSGYLSKKWNADLTDASAKAKQISSYLRGLPS
jgi:hypothetical protein